MEKMHINNKLEKPMPKPSVYDEGIDVPAETYEKITGAPKDEPDVDQRFAARNPSMPTFGEEIAMFRNEPAKEKRAAAFEFNNPYNEPEPKEPFVYKGAIEMPESLKQGMGTPEKSIVDAGLKQASLTRDIISAMRSGNGVEVARIQAELNKLDAAAKEATQH